KSGRKRKKIMIVVSLLIAIALISSSLFYYYYGILPSDQGIKRTFVSTPIQSQYITEYPTETSTSSPNGIATDSQGNVWFALEGETAIAELYPSNNTMHVFPLPEPKNPGLTTWGIAVDNTRNLVWFTDSNNNSIWAFNILTSNFTKHPLLTKFAFPYQLALDNQGNVWFTELYGNKIGEITVQGQLGEFAVPAPNSSSLSYGPGPSGITVDKKNNEVWFTEAFTNSVASYLNGHFELYNLSNLITAPVGIAIDSKGNLWITQHGPSFISEFNPETHYFRTISTSIQTSPNEGTSLPYFIQVDSRGNVWFNEHYGNAIAMFSPSNNTLIEYEIPSRLPSAGNISSALTIALSADGQPWFTELFTGNIGTVNTHVPTDLSFKE
ncbi:MAG: SMP-30/gluconolactonase/LRE family protein, partial [Thaumarchaeota archaeon]|nr:SMP-30/gluconolactonase/LRE family protein [Nitrososphaerota archaeon]